MKTKSNLMIFTVLVLVLPWLGKWVDIQTQSPPGEGPGALIWIGSPLLIAFLLRGFGGDGWKDLGIKPNFKGNLLWYLISMLVYPTVILIIIVIGRAFGIITFPELSEEALALLIQGSVTMLIMQSIKNIFEEFAFRGYLAPKMYTLKMNTFVSHGIVGLIWGVWHLPYIRYITPYTMESLVTLTPRLVLGAIAASMVYGEIRLKTDSVWPAWLMHTVGATVVTAFMLYSGMTFSSGTEWLFQPVFEGGLTIVFFVVVGIVLHQLRRK
jgi:membrane protease YdiL (CAAX protease family)